MDTDTAETRNETIAALNAALAELEGGEGLGAPERGLSIASNRRFPTARRTLP